MRVPELPASLAQFCNPRKVPALFHVFPCQLLLIFKK